MDGTKITTAVFIDDSGSMNHIPTEVSLIDEQYYATINSFYPGLNHYLIWNPVKVQKVENHWSKTAVNDLASRLIINKLEIFEPNQSITRAEFAEYIVRALGVYREDITILNGFTDVDSSNEQILAILIANEYGIVQGYPDDTFRSQALITREEAMTMYQRAMKITKLVGTEEKRFLNYKDFAEVGTWATTYVKEVLSAHVFNGTTTTIISPKSNLTYAEAAQAIKNLLVKSKLINN